MFITVLALLIPLGAWIIIAKIFFKHEFTLQEMALQFGVTAIAIMGIVFAGFSSQTSDTMMVNGIVTNMNPVKRTCSQYWSDYADSFCTNQHTRTVRNGESCSTIDGKRRCTPKYKTQYKSVYSWERRYFIVSTLGEYEVRRVDNQGVKTPPRFESANVGDPVAATVTYTNYIKGAASTLFNQKLQEVVDVKYPEVYDLYHIDRVFYTDLPSPPFLNQWNRDLEKLNAKVAKTGANVIINVTSKSQVWAEQLSQSWDAHNINDVVIVIGVEGEKIAWVDVRDWSADKMLGIIIRDLIMMLPRVDKDMINQIVDVTVSKHYKAQKMEDFKYLEDDITTPNWVLILVGLILVIITPATSWFLSANEHRNFKSF